MLSACKVCHFVNLCIFSFTSVQDPARRRVVFRKINRKCIFSYRLPDNRGVSQSVCKTMFLGTLGYSNNTSLVKLMRKKTPRDELAPVPKQGGGFRFEFDRIVSIIPL